MSAMHQTHMEGLCSKAALRSSLSWVSQGFCHATDWYYLPFMEGTSLLWDLLEFSLPHCNSHCMLSWTNFPKTLLLLSHSNSLNLHLLIAKMDMFMFSLLTYLILLLKGSKKILEAKVPCKLKSVLDMTVCLPIIGSVIFSCGLSDQVCAIGLGVQGFIIRHVPDLPTSLVFFPFPACPFGKPSWLLLPSGVSLWFEL